MRSPAAIGGEMHTLLGVAEDDFEKASKSTLEGIPGS